MSIQPGVVNLFNSIVSRQNVTWAQFDCYTISLFGGGALYYTTAPFDIALNGNTYASGTVRVDTTQSKTQAHWKVGLDVDQWTVAFMPRPFEPITGAAFPDQIGGVPWLQAASAGALDAADLQVDRVWFNAMPTAPLAPGPQNPIGSRTIFVGSIAEVDITTTAAILVVNDYRQLFTTQMPRDFYQGQCRHTLFDAGCNASGTFLPASFVEAGSAQAGSTQANIVTTGLPVAPGTPGTYALGRIVMTSGLNATFQRTVRTWDGVNLGLFNPLPFAVSPGDTFNAYPGCAKTLAACTAFANQLNYGGQPFIPNPEQAS